MPERIQLRRTRGWRKPDGAVVVARPSRWGNPLRLDDTRILTAEGLELWSFPGNPARARAHCVRAFGWQLEHHPNVVGFTVDDVRRELAGRDLACWCPLDVPCHADMLLEVANR